MDIEQLSWAVGHDACRAGDREPLGAVAVGTDVSVVLRVAPESRHLVESAEVLVGERHMPGLSMSWRAEPLSPCERGFCGSFSLEANPHVAFYVFRLRAGGQTCYYVPRADGRATAGELVTERDGAFGEGGWSYGEERLTARPTGDFGLPDALPGFQVTVHAPAFETPEWMAGAIIYQVFPDRFCQGSRGIRAEGVSYHKRMGRPVHLRSDWDEPWRWDDGTQYDPFDFAGGTLQGIREKLPYLASLGVEAIYLNPVFEARSNHRYDTADYERIDPLLGDEDDFSVLAREAGEWGIALILDAVLSHTGSDSRYFNLEGTYGQSGAAQGEGSPYRSWYDFNPQGNGAPYRCWWGDPSLPEVDERNLGWQRYILGCDAGQPGLHERPDAVGDEHAAGSKDASNGASRRGILAKWLSAGARGYRLDVADEIPDDVLAKLRASVKAANPEAAIIGEVWEDATTKASYGTHRDFALGTSLDSVMNYPLRSALIGFAIGKVDAQQLTTFLKSQQSNYPAHVYRGLMNLLSSHDVERVRSVLALGHGLKNLPRSQQCALVEGITRDQDERAARLQRMIVGILYALPGMPCVYYGDERGLQGGGDPFCRATFPWDERAVNERGDCGCDLTQWYRDLGMRRKASRVLRQGAFTCAAPHEDVVCVVRALPDEGPFTIVAANRSEVERVVAVDLHGEALWHGQVDEFEQGIAKLVVPPQSAVYFSW